MNDILNTRYLRWLAGVVGILPNHQAFYILKTMHHHDFQAFVSFDDNRAADGVQLRQRFSLEMDVDIPGEWLNEDAHPCTFLEMLVALSDRMGMQVDVSTDKAFWRLARNMGLSKMSAPSNEEIECAIDRVNRRTYNHDSTNGGLFPLSHSVKDQRYDDLFSQMQAYIMEMGM